MKVKVCGMRNPENIEKIIKLKPDYMGFIFYPKSKRYIGDIEPTMLTNGLFKKTKKVGVFVNELLRDVVVQSNTYGLDLVQLHGNESEEYCYELHCMDVPVIKAFGIDDDFDFHSTSDFAKYCDYFLFDTKIGNQSGGTGKKFDWGILENYNTNIPFFLSGGIDVQDLDEIKKIDHPQLYGVDINSKFETEPAIKNVNKVEEFIKNLKG